MTDKTRLPKPTRVGAHLRATASPLPMDAAPRPAAHPAPLERAAPETEASHEHMLATGASRAADTNARQTARSHAEPRFVQTPDAHHEPVPIALSPEAAARFIGVSRGHLFKLIGAGVLPRLKLGSRTLVPRSALERLIAEAA